MGAFLWQKREVEDEQHKYSQQATKALLVVFFSTSAIIILKTWWPLIIIVVTVVGWYVFNMTRKTVPLFDLTDRNDIIVQIKWLQMAKKQM
ncbi:hypothetical protein HCJ66_13835 [Listeria sp. FSL L7-1582]|uniref:hypothetical protein n=1 Tax=Listeria portnoyi TaxID=2713504 RepID=UPI00164DBF89|nr:hypothetical protein [Listeria portnoyi]MBC6310615.1 hypothetical protein [Listeria portnoyi]